MGSRMIRDRSNRGGWWLMVGLFTLCVVGWSLAFSLKVGAGDLTHPALGGTADRDFGVSNFDRIKLAGSLDVVLQQGEVEAVLGRGDADDLDRLEVYVAGGELVIKPKRSSWWRWGSSDSVRLLVMLREVDRVSMSGSGDLNAQRLELDELRLAVSGSGDVRIGALETADFDLRISGSADVAVGGSAPQQTVQISGSGDYDGSGLASAAVEIRVSGSGDARVQASETLAARVSGSGTVRYSGSPVVDQRVSGSGSVFQGG